MMQVWSNNVYQDPIHRVLAKVAWDRNSLPFFFNLENALGREKDVQAIDLDSVMKKCVVTYMDVGYADNAGCNYLSPYW